VTAGGASEPPIAQHLRPLLADAEARLAAALDGAACAVAASGRRGMMDSLAHRLGRACAPIVARDRSASWPERFAAFGALRPLLDRVTSDWLRAIVELSARLGDARAHIAASFFDGRPPGAITSFRGDAGDQHGGGRCVTLLEFEGGPRLVYKPKDLRVAEAWNALVRFLARAGLPLPLRTPALLAAGDHAWQEHVAAAPCRSAEEIGRFYRRIGMLLRLGQLLEARDLWLDNVVAAGEHPVLFDLETLLQPRWRQPAASAARARADELLRESVAPIGILAMHTLIAPGVAAEDLGAVTPPRPLRSPFRPDPAVGLGIEGRQRDGFRTWTHPDHAPTLAGQAHAGAHHLREILEGHREMHACLAANRAELLASDGPLAAFARAELHVRVILRNTWAYHRILDASLVPALMVDATTRAAALAAGPWASGVREPERLERAFASERAALLRLDVPYFLARADGADLLADDGTTLASDVFLPGGARRLRGRVEQLDAFPLEAHAAILETTLATGHRPTAARAAETSARIPRAPHARDWLAAAVAAGDLMLRHGFGDQGERAWLGIAYDPLHDLAQLQVLGSDLVTGTTGIAVALSELHAVTGEPRFRQAAQEALAPLERELADERLPPCLGLCGLGGQLWGAARCAALRGERLPASVRRAADRGLARAAEQDPGDVASGPIGLALAALAIDAGTRDDVERLARVWEPASPRARARDLTPPAARIRGALPGVDASWRLLRHRLGAAGTPSKKKKEVGDMLVDLAVLPPPRLLAAATASARARLAENRKPALDLAPLALHAFEATGDAWFFDRARALAAALVDSHRHDARWFAAGGGADRHQLSILWGLPAIVRLLLRVGGARIPIPQPQLLAQFAPG
jgi:type 2 lantibiotic biosynthesis protein LanM